MFYNDLCFKQMDNILVERYRSCDCSVVLQLHFLYTNYTSAMLFVVCSFIRIINVIFCFKIVILCLENSEKVKNQI